MPTLEVMFSMVIVAASGSVIVQPAVPSRPSALVAHLQHSTAQTHDVVTGTSFMPPRPALVALVAALSC
jgi:hypothetical protein